MWSSLYQEFWPPLCRSTQPLCLWNPRRIGRGTWRAERLIQGKAWNISQKKRVFPRTNIGIPLWLFSEKCCMFKITYDYSHYILFGRTCCIDTSHLYMLRCSACLSTGWTHNLPSSVARSWQNLPTRSWSTGEFDTLSSSLCTSRSRWYVITYNYLGHVAMKCDMFQSQPMSWTLESLAIVSACPLSLAAVTALMILCRKPVLSRVLVPHGGHRSIWHQVPDKRALFSRWQSNIVIHYLISEFLKCVISVSLHFYSPPTPAMVVPPGDSTAFLSCAGCLTDQCHQPFLGCLVKICFPKKTDKITENDCFNHSERW